MADDLSGTRKYLIFGIPMHDTGTDLPDTHERLGSEMGANHEAALRLWGARNPEIAAKWVQFHVVTDSAAKVLTGSFESRFVVK